MANKDESRSSIKFKELAEKRVVRAINSIRLVGNLSNRTNYTYSNDDAKKIVRALQKEIYSLKRRFEEYESGDEAIFKL